MSVGVEERLAERPVDMATARLPQADGGARDVPGFYAWWLPDASALPMVPLGAGGLLYIGIAPRDAESAATIRSRILGDHLGNAIGRSTLRRGLTAFLWEPMAWPPFMKGAKVALSPEHCAALTAWMEQHLRVSWCPVGEPWSYEATLIGETQPPLNSDHNHSHPFYPTLRAARKDLMAVAREAAPIRPPKPLIASSNLSSAASTSRNELSNCEASTLMVCPQAQVRVGDLRNAPALTLTSRPQVSHGTSSTWSSNIPIAVATVLGHSIDSPGSLVDPPPTLDA